MNSLKFWTSENFEVSSYQFRLSERVNQTYTRSGSDNTDLCKYTYNELGFRGDSIDKNGFKIMSLGCSLTEGIGVNNDKTWPAQFTKLVSNGVNLNFGHGGRSNDFITRCLLTYYDIINPDLILIMYTESHRREFFTPNGGIEPFHTKKWGYFDETIEGEMNHRALVTLSNKEADFQNWYKNHLLIKYFLESKKAKWLWNGWFATNDYTDALRFDGGYYPFIDNGVDGQHPGPETNKLYAKNLYNHIISEFPGYLPL